MGTPHILFILRAQKNYLPPGQFFSNCFPQDRVFKENTTILRDQKTHGVPHFFQIFFHFKSSKGSGDPIFNSWHFFRISFPGISNSWHFFRISFPGISNSWHFFRISFPGISNSWHFFPQELEIPGKEIRKKCQELKIPFIALKMVVFSLKTRSCGKKFEKGSPVCLVFKHDGKPSFSVPFISKK